MAKKEFSISLELFYCKIIGYRSALNRVRDFSFNSRVQIYRKEFERVSSCTLIFVRASIVIQMPYFFLFAFKVRNIGSNSDRGRL